MDVSKVIEQTPHFGTSPHLHGNIFDTQSRRSFGPLDKERYAPPKNSVIEVVTVLLCCLKHLFILNRGSKHFKTMMGTLV